MMMMMTVTMIMIVITEKLMEMLLIIGLDICGTVSVAYFDVAWHGPMAYLDKWFF